MSRIDWNEAAGFMSAFAMFAGVLAAAFVPGMKWAAFVGVVPAAIYCALVLANGRGRRPPRQKAARGRDL